MLQKAILQIDQSKGVKGGSSSENRFQNRDGVTAAAARRLAQGAPGSAGQTGGVQGVSGRVGQTGGMQGSAAVSDGVITVQYNPASLKYRASTSTRGTAEPDVGASTKLVTSIARKSTVDLSLELVFHSTGDQDESVREQMELVMNMIYDSPTKNVKFAWGTLAIEGKLTSFSGEYDMFDPLGRPVSGRMSLTIRTETTLKQVDKAIDEIEKEHRDKPAAQAKEGGRQNETGVSAAEKKIL